MKILYLCNKKTYETKMSRVRFHGMEAISKFCEVIWSGKGWENYNNEKTVSENIEKIYKGGKPDIVVAYKPFNLKNFKDLKISKCIRYNEMWDFKSTFKEILDNNIDIVVCHHLNDMKKYIKVKELSNVKFINLPHCAEKTIYKDYGLEKTIDVLFVGAVSRHYPFRARLKSILLNNLKDKLVCEILKHPGDTGINYKNIKGYTLDNYAKKINSSKIVLTCSSKYKYRLGKYVEIPMCRSLLAADLPDEEHGFFKKFMLELDTNWSDKKISDKIIDYCNDEEKRKEITDIGYKINNKYFTQEKYAERFLHKIEEVL